MLNLTQSREMYLRFPAMYKKKKKKKDNGAPTGCHCTVYLTMSITHRLSEKDTAN